jgi:hypothetical protein
MRGQHNKDNSFVYLISDEKIAEFRGMSLRARLHWLEVANVFVNKAIGARRRALFDSRFEALISKK